MKDRDSLVRSSGIISAATLGSRILGLVRDQMIASVFDRALTVPFLTAFIIPNTLRRLFAEGALSAAFIPVFSECLQREGRERAARLGASLFKALFLVLVVVALLGSLLAPQIFQLLPASDKVSTGHEALAIQLLRIMFPYILLIGLSAATMGMLNSLDRFFAPAISPALLNIAMIGSITLGGLWLSDAPLVRLLAFGVLLGGCLQLLVQLVPLERQMPLHLFRTPLWDPKLKQVLVLMIPLTLGQAITEVNILISTAFAWKIQATDYLFFSNRVIQFPLGVFGIAIATAAFPRLSRDAVHEEDGRREIAETAIFALKKILYVILPSTVGLILVGRDVVGAIFDHGKFHEQGALGPTFACAVYYALGLPAFAAQKIVVAAFYARQNPRTPMRVGALVVGANVILILLLIGPLQAGGLALATTLSSYLNLTILSLILACRLHLPLFRRLAGPLGRSGLCALLMGLGVGAVGLLLPEAASRLPLYLLRVGVLLPLGAGLYLAASWFLQREETLVIFRAFADRLRRTPSKS